MTTTAPPVEQAREQEVPVIVDAGWLAAHAGRIPKKLYATASSPIQGLIE